MKKMNMNNHLLLRKKANRQRPGLILLVVLGMLALFSLLTVTYVVFSSQSRATAVALARKDVRGNQSRTPILEEAIKQLLRGSVDSNSVVYGQSILGDLYGDRESVAIATGTGLNPAARQAAYLQIRNRQFNVTNLNVTPMSYAANSLQRPMLLANHFLRIPLEPGTYNNSPILPAEHDALNGRVITFPESSGPLSGQSFRIVRYIGRIAPYASPTQDDVTQFSQCYSIVIDLLEADLSRTYSRFDDGSGRIVTETLAEWIAQTAQSGQTHQAGIYVCYADVDLGGSLTLSGGYPLLLNATPLNSHGIGMLNDGSSEFHRVVTNPAAPGYGSPANRIPTGLLPHFQFPEIAGGFENAAGGTTATRFGDSDEPYDAADFANWFLAHRFSGAATSADIIPSFHRAALVNYIVNLKDPLTYTPEDLLLVLERIATATGRPLSINVTTPSGGFQRHPDFTGSNQGTATQVPQLTISIPSNWNTAWPSTGIGPFTQWLNWLTTGPWDVDNDADGINDSMWVDVGIPLQTSADGKLLKALVSYYVEDLDSKLDVNATSSFAQTQANYATAINNDFADRAAGSTFLPQGIGYGPAESSFRHLLAKAPRFNVPNVPVGTQLAAQNTAFTNILRSRYYDSLQTSFSPGIAGNDAISDLRMREQRNIFAHGSLPGFPMGTHGRASIALDRLGNARAWNVDNSWTQSLNEPYESRWKSPSIGDSPFTLSEWERIYRVGDGDRSALPSRLEDAFGELPNTIATSNLRHEITPISSNLRVPMMSVRGLANSTVPTTFIEFVNRIREMRGEQVIPTTYPFPLTEESDRQFWRGFASLFPLEFSRGLPMDLNRPLGNGVDDDGDGQIDEPQELVAGQAAYYVTGQTSTGPSGSAELEYLQGQPRIAPDGNNSQLFDPHLIYTGGNASPALYSNTLDTRQFYARHLYCLAQLIIPQDYVFPNVNEATFNALSAQEKTLERARILAQWAVNVVDFRDLDSAMTRFPYDPTPFEPKTDPNTGDTYIGWLPSAAVGTERFVVWGMEQPELLISESFATHDIRVKRDDQSGTPRWNQYRIPQGSLFLEFYCPRSTGPSINQTVQGVSPALYDTNGVSLDLTALAPGGTPVWRTYISGPQTPGETPATVYNDATRKRELTYQLPVSNYRFSDTMGTLAQDALNRDSDELALNAGLVFDRNPTAGTTLPEPDPETSRILVFTPGFTPTLANSPGVHDPEAQVFFSNGSSPRLRGGEYLVVGPRNTTNFGSKIAAFSDPTDPVNRPNNHRIQLGGSWAQMYTTDAADPNYTIQKRTTMRNCVTMIAGCLTPPSWPTDNTVASSVGLNVSEPLTKDSDYYQVPTTTVNPGDNSTDPDNGAVGFGDSNFRNDAYHDYSSGPPTTLAAFDDGTAGPLSNWTLAQDTVTGAVETGTQEDWSTAYLQRLADPEKPWDATFNPYITVDWLPIDLTVFSGEENHSDVQPQNLLKFASRQKTGHAIEQRGTAANPEFIYNDSAVIGGETFYSYANHAPRETDSLENQTGNPPTTFFDHELYMDRGAGIPGRPSQVSLDDNTNETFVTLGFLNSTFRLAGEDGTTNTSSYVGMPAVPVGTVADWIPDSPFWANKQFTNTHELAMVPLSAPGQFMQEFSALTNTSGGSRFEPTTGNSDFTPFRHLLSFTNEAEDDIGTTPQVRDIVPMSVLFDLVETASPWCDANEFESPASVAFEDPSTYATNMQPIIRAKNSALYTLRAPYNKVSRYVEAGRLNINTIAEQNVFQGLWYNTLSPADRQTIGPASVATPWNAFFMSRMGYTPAAGFYSPPGGTRFNPNFPTQFAGVFKPAMEAGMSPPLQDNTLNQAQTLAPASVTLLRPVDATGAQKLLSSTQTFASENALSDTLPASRLVNLTTNRSNVFAVYVTLGLFEYDETTGRLRQEYGSDRGEAQRYKAFYVIDRSKPVGFETGVDHNVENTILIRRYLSE